MRKMLMLTTLSLVISAGPTLAADRNCFHQKDAQLKIKGCSDLIDRNPKDAAAYHNRAEAYSMAGDLDRAIADYSKTIEIKPDTVGAYDGRGRAYAAKGDYVRAVPDVTKARELIAAAARSAVVAPKEKALKEKVPKAPKAVASSSKPANTAVVRAAGPNNALNGVVHDWPAWAKFKESATN